MQKWHTKYVHKVTKIKAKLFTENAHCLKKYVNSLFINKYKRQVGFAC
jgi:hypothetical protein